MSWTMHAEVDYHQTLMKPSRASVGSYKVSLSSHPPKTSMHVRFTLTCCAGGLESEYDYTYRGHKQKCNFATERVAAYINSSVELPTDENGQQTDGRQIESERQDRA